MILEPVALVHHDVLPRHLAQWILVEHHEVVMCDQDVGVQVWQLKSQKR